ncbi:unnamed protein product [Candida verbasci]|uniref:Kinesin-like protein n=1 Tax=Candida verbasci TaxID=1227364 RepID=A0A9W4TX67_9ASCO|nr:unnamed protein product [Candida verbasci]
MSSSAAATLNTPAYTITSHPIKQSSISVAVRVRPFTQIENNNLIKSDQDDFYFDGSLAALKERKLINPIGIRNIINVVDEKMLIFDPPDTNPLMKMQRNAFPNKSSRIREHRFIFDKVFDQNSSQDDVYKNTTRPLLNSILDGYNATVFAYGATGCGKTHTISGVPQDPGVIFLTMQELYCKIDELKDTKIIDVSLSYLEIYNETIRDLLNPEIDYKKLNIREDSNNKISVSNLTSHRPNSVDEVMDLIIKGNQNRTCSPTEANLTSSRSHAVLQINVVQKNRTCDVQEENLLATLSIIDLAGSERAASTKNRGARLNEGANINKSLLALGNCINALCDPRRRNHVPYRDSKLTRLLKFSLGGNCKTVMIVCISPSSNHYDETLNTLKYADRAKEIKTKLIRNASTLDRHVGSYLKMITEQKAEIEELRMRENNVVEMTNKKRDELQNKVFRSLFDSLSSTKKSLTKYNQDKSRRYFLLAKRKLLLLQKIDAEVILSTKYNNSDELISTIYNLCEQLVSKIEYQLPQLEDQYQKPSDIEHILNDSAKATLKRLQEEDGWTDYHTLFFEEQIKSMRDKYHTDLLLYSSILFDSLIHDLKDFLCLPKTISNLLLNQDYTILNQLVNDLENLVNGEFDTTIDNYAINYLKQQYSDEDFMMIDEQQPKKKPRVTTPKFTRKSKNSPLRGDKKKYLKYDSMIDSSIDDISFDESPIITDSMIQPLDLNFDPMLDSPPSIKNPSKIKKKSPQLSNRKISLNLSDSKLPLLNTQAASKVNK